MDSDDHAEDANSLVGGQDLMDLKKKRRKKKPHAGKEQHAGKDSKIDARSFLAKGKGEAEENDNEAYRDTVSRTTFSDRPNVRDGVDCVVVGTSLKGGTIQKVLEWIIFFEKTDATVVDFILAFDAFVPVWKVVNILIQLYNACTFPPDRLQVAEFAHRV